MELGHLHETTDLVEWLVALDAIHYHVDVAERLVAARRDGILEDELRLGRRGGGSLDVLLCCLVPSIRSCVIDAFPTGLHEHSVA